MSMEIRKIPGCIEIETDTLNAVSFFSPKLYPSICKRLGIKEDLFFAIDVWGTYIPFTKEEFYKFVEAARELIYEMEEP